MKTLRRSFTRFALALLLAFSLSSLTACGGGHGGGTDSTQPPPANGPQGLRFSIDSNYGQMVYSVDISGPTGEQKETLGLNAGQEMFVPLPTGDYALRFWIYAGNGFSVVDHQRREAIVYPSQTTIVPYP